MYVSSAYILGWHEDRQFGKPLMQMRNKRGPRIVPWGTPHLSEQILETVKGLNPGVISKGG